MTAKEKAKEIVEKYTKIKVVVLGCGKEEGNPCIIEDNINQISAKQCAIIAVDEMIKDSKESLELSKELYQHANGLIAGSLVFWQEVKTELK